MNNSQWLWMKNATENNNGSERLAILSFDCECSYSLMIPCTQSTPCATYWIVNDNLDRLVPLSNIDGFFHGGPGGVYCVVDRVYGVDSGSS